MQRVSCLWGGSGGRNSRSRGAESSVLCPLRSVSHTPRRERRTQGHGPWTPAKIKLLRTKHREGGRPSEHGGLCGVLVLRSQGLPAPVGVGGQAGNAAGLPVTLSFFISASAVSSIRSSLPRGSVGCKWNIRNVDTRPFTTGRLPDLKDWTPHAQHRAPLQGGPAALHAAAQVMRGPGGARLRS